VQICANHLKQQYINAILGINQKKTTTKELINFSRFKDQIKN